MTDEERYERNKNEFRSVVKGLNFITPRVVDYIRAGKYICEIAGSGTEGYTKYHIYGVTVVDTEVPCQYDELCKCFVEESYAEAKRKAFEYVNELVEKYGDKK